MKVRVLPEAVRDADAPAAWYERHVAGLGRDFLDQVSATYELIRTAPDGESLLETVDVEGIVRRRRLKRFSYLVIYQCLPMYVVVLAAAHERRHPRFWVNRMQY